jgi:hypothetical protein
MGRKMRHRRTGSAPRAGAGVSILAVFLIAAGAAEAASPNRDISGSHFGAHRPADAYRWRAPKTSAAEDIVISSAKTQNVTCSKGICSPTGKYAVLNAGDLEDLLAKSNIEVTTGNGKSRAGNLTVAAGLSWKSANTLALDAYNSILVEALVAVEDKGGVSLTINDGGADGQLTFDFDKGGRISFANLSSSFIFEDTSFTLVGDIKTLASDVAANPAGDFALADNYNAKQDGAYSRSPVPTTLTGVFVGLGNTISNVTIDDTTENDPAVGLFASLMGNGARTIRKGQEFSGALGWGKVALMALGLPPDAGSSQSDAGGLVGDINDAVLDNIAAEKIRITWGQDSRHAPAQNYYAFAGGLVGMNNSGQIINCTASGVSIKGGNAATSLTGGLVGEDYKGTISNSSASGAVSDSTANTYTGGLVGLAAGTTLQGSSSSAQIVIGGGAYGGGLVGSTAEYTSVTIDSSHATGKVKGGDGSLVGGLVGNFWQGEIDSSYATGAVSGTPVAAGGLIGSVDDDLAISNSHATGAVTVGDGALAGGLAGESAGTITDSYATGAVSGGANAASVGGLIGVNSGGITESFATGDVTGGSGSMIGGLAGQSGGTLANTYATGAVNGGDGSSGVSIGGLIGVNYTAVSDSYATGAVQQVTNSNVGGVVGEDESSNGFSDTYWDTTTTGITDPGQGAGNVANDPGLAGETTKQLQSGLPDGFADTVWAEDKKVNDGLPYLVSNPPPK